MTDATPMDTFRRLNITPGPWATGAGRTYRSDGEPVWEIDVPSVATPAIRDLAHLTFEGWNVTIRRVAGRVIGIRILRDRDQH